MILRALIATHTILFTAIPSSLMLQEELISHIYMVCYLLMSLLISSSILIFYGMQKSSRKENKDDRNRSSFMDGSPPLINPET